MDRINPQPTMETLYGNIGSAPFEQTLGCSIHERLRTFTENYVDQWRVRPGTLIGIASDPPKSNGPTIAMSAEQHYADLIIRQALRIRDLRQAMIRARSECDHGHPRAARCVLNEALEDSKATILAHVPVQIAPGSGVRFGPDETL